MSIKTSGKAAKANVSLTVESIDAVTTDFAIIPRDDLPLTVELIGPFYQVFSQTVSLIRIGFVFDSEEPLTMFQTTGQVSVNLVKGDPDSVATNAAYKALEISLAREAMAKLDAEQRAIAAAAKQAEEETKAAAKAAIEAQIAQQQASLRQLEAELAKA